MRPPAMLRGVKLLVCGAGGMLGQDVVRAARFTNHEVAALDRAALDVSDERAVRRAMERERPAAVVNCAAYTAVDAAEDDSDAAMRLNAAPRARWPPPRRSAAPAWSTRPPTTSSTAPARARTWNPTSPRPSRSTAGPSWPARWTRPPPTRATSWCARSWLFGTGGRNFVETMLEIAERDSQVLVVRDQVGCPTWTGHLAAGIVRLLDTDAYGLHHMSAQGECSWYDFAMAIFEEAGVDCRVLSTTTAEFARPAPRPAYSVLGTQWQDAIHLPEWQVGLRGYLEDRA